jgi:hypothetical protein
LLELNRRRLLHGNLPARKVKTPLITADDERINAAWPVWQRL